MAVLNVVYMNLTLVITGTVVFHVLKYSCLCLYVCMFSLFYMVCCNSPTECCRFIGCALGVYAPVAGLVVALYRCNNCIDYTCVIYRPGDFDIIMGYGASIL